VNFAYDGAAGPALNDISFELRHGQSIGLIGTSGAGKTTLVDMLLGFHKPQSGRILVDGVDVEVYGWRAWREQIAYLPQDASLLDDSIEANIAFGVPPEKIDHARIESAIEWAQLSGLVSRLPHGRKTFIGEFGVRLSGGERQRLALARGFYFDRKVFILDEATSSLDTETEAQVIDVINRLHGEKTLIVIAHRLNTVRVCDLIYRLEKGRIVESGRFEEIVGNPAAHAQA
jgi:ABC-type multidrug transport system fused ATPase/permease subunit